MAQISTDSYYAGLGRGGALYTLNATCVGAGGTTLADNGGTVIKDAGNNCWLQQETGSTVPSASFGVHSDVVTTVFDGAITAGTKSFTSSTVTFTAADVGKIFQYSAAGGVNPWRTTIASLVSAHTVLLADNAPNVYPGSVQAKQVDFNSSTSGGNDAPGAGYKQGDVLTVSGGTGTSATVTVTNTALVAYTMTSGGTNFVAGDQIGLTATTGNTAVMATILVDTVNGGGTILTSHIINGGRFKVAGANPVAFTQSSDCTSRSPACSGFTFSLLAADASFGLGKMTLTTAGLYSALPPFPSNTTYGGTGTGGQVELTFSAPTWTYGSDDTTPLANLESYLETNSTRGQVGATILPCNSTTFASSLTINRPVSWFGCGSRSSSLQMILGSAGAVVNGARAAFLVFASNVPPADPYQSSSSVQNQPTFQNIAVLGTSSSTTVDIGGSTGLSTSTDCIALTNPSSNNIDVGLVFNNVQSKFCPGNGISIASKWNGELEAYNLLVGGDGGNCIDVQNYHNPSRFYRLIATNCGNYGLNFNTASSLEFHGASVFGNTINIYVSGFYTKSNGGYLVFDGLQLGNSTNENFYDDASNETVYCLGICRFKDPNQGGSTSVAEANSSLAIGPDVSSATGLLQPAVVIDDGVFQQGDNSNFNDVFFVSPFCDCNVVLGGSTRNVDTGTIATNKIGLISGPRFSVPPTLQTRPSILSGFGTNPSVSAANGAGAFEVTIGSGGTASTGALTLPTSPNGWACSAADVTTPATNFTKQTASSTTSATLTNYNTSNAAAAWTAGDKLNVSCSPF